MAKAARYTRVSERLNPGLLDPDVGTELESFAEQVGATDPHVALLPLDDGPAGREFAELLLAATQPAGR